jgi:flagellar motor switch protein FliM
VEKILKISDLINFKAGDIIPIEMPDQVMLLAENMPVMRGQYGAHRGNAAVKIEDIVEIYDPENVDIKNAVVLGNQKLPGKNKK